MIVRFWRGRTQRADKAAYLAFLKEKGLSGYQATPGNLGITLMTRDVGDTTEYLLMTCWTSLDAIRSFAGPDVDKAVYYPEDDGFLLDFPEKVEHFEVVSEEH